MTTQTRGKGAEVAAYIGLDWADQKHVGCLQAVDSTHSEEFTLEQTPETVHEWVERLRRRFGGARVAIALEQSRGALIYALMNYDFLVLYPINPRGVVRFRETFRSSGCKDDGNDAWLLKELVRNYHDQLAAWQPDDELTRTLRLLVEHRRTLVNDRTRLTNRLTQQLKNYFPQALCWIEDLSQSWACRFLMKWPSLTALQKARPESLSALWSRHGLRRKRLEQLREQIKSAQSLTTDRAVLTACAAMVTALARQVLAASQGIEALDQLIEQHMARHPDAAFWQSLPGAGPALAPRLLAAYGADRGRWDEARQIQQFSGIAPVTRQSGKCRTVHHRLQCPKFVKQTFHEFAKCSIPRSRWAKAYYLLQREQRRKEHHAAVRALAFKWLRVLFHCWKHGKPYDEAYHLAQLRRRGSPLIAFLAEGPSDPTPA